MTTEIGLVAPVAIRPIIALPSNITVTDKEPQDSIIIIISDLYAPYTQNSSNQLHLTAKISAFFETAARGSSGGWMRVLVDPRTRQEWPSKTRLLHLIIGENSWPQFTAAVCLVRLWMEIDPDSHMYVCICTCGIAAA